MNRERFEFLKTDYLQGFPAFCGFLVETVSHGTFVTRLQITRDHEQQDGFVHAGVIATMADHTAGYAAYTTVDPAYRILTVEFKINYLRPAAGPLIRCRSQVINAGKTIILSESEIFSCPTVSPNGTSPLEEKLVSKAMVTLMAVPKGSVSKARLDPMS